ncbi:MAG: hypothetical protein QM534_14015 [Sediminibacterium sp.]|nr:hypothetical protein [Sediminibacterium sp.]
MKNIHKCVLLLVFLAFKFSAQNCSTCSVTINDNSSSSYTINAGHTLCIDSLGNFEGSIVINGGLLCNKGIFSPSTVIFSGGTIQNYGLMTYPGNVLLTNGITLNNLPSGVINITGMLELNGGIIDNQGVWNVKKGLINTMGGFTNSGIFNCEHLSGSNTISNSGTLNTED